jgi:putative DNA primase/helicase
MSGQNVVALPRKSKRTNHEALDLAELGFWVFPLQVGGKEPACRGGHLAATCDPERIRALWHNPHFNIGIWPAKKSATVLDIDVKNGKRGFDTLAKLEAEHGPLPATWTIQTPSGGEHRWFKGILGSGTDKLGEGLDIKCNGYVLLPPSAVDGKPYREALDSVVHGYAAAPAWLATIAKPVERKEISAATGEPVPIDHLRKLLSYIDPGCDRDAWRNVVAGCCACNVPDAGEEQVAELVCEWSRGDLHGGKQPANYSGDDEVREVQRTMPPKAGGVGYGTVLTAARAGGYDGPPARPSLFNGNVEATAAAKGEIQKIVPGSEDNLAVVFTQVHGDRLRYVADWNRWLAFDGCRWAEVPEPFIWNLARPLLRECADRLADNPATRRKMTSKTTIASVASLARGDVLAKAEQFDADPWLLNTPGGIVDLRTGEARPASRDDYCIKTTAVAPDGAKHPLWSKFLDDVTAGDPELHSYLRRFAGYSLTGLTREHVMQFKYGTGNNGKGAYLGTLGSIMGSYAIVAPVDMFTETRGDRHPTDMAMLQGARLVSAQETEEGRYWAEAKIKALTGGDRIRARFMRGDFFEFTPQFKLIIAGNHKPRLRSVDEAFRRRLHFVPFVVTIPVKDRDPELPAKLKAEWPAILQWAIEGCLDWQMLGLSPPPVVLDMTRNYFTSQDALAGWVAERVMREPGAWTAHKAAYASWEAWRGENEEHEYIGPKQFTERLERHGYLVNRKNAGNGFVGMKIRG